ncbi:TrkH family potassium uptake protein [Halalkalicoccus jeotgali]|uniref:Cation transporter n=1 Tax=Halalkalicoccus jeotgali (strain DSM 18796 / CECT 7217 / JCM 14584 / KCTC 4019 / B3) TaxID=795797 RepID=D8J3P4_HALJB|nr:TrkH family potassium uptake protein [Halalkalicoccus jeotgali]ADJ15351.1 cation transporter [Halalkalicoccus jeotgali B3]ELY35436.1 cation transporter [Halalkalicoccus jeotgali B3]
MGGTPATVGRDLGRVLLAFSGLVFVSVAVSLVWGEYYAIPGLLVSGAIPLSLGWALSRRYADAREPGKFHGMVIAASGWLLIALFGSLPFLAVAWTVTLAPDRFGTPEMTSTLRAFRSPLNALFESMSGFTGTGLTMADRESVLPRTLQWWRSFSEWVGGVGVIVLTTAILTRAGSGSLTLYESEARSERIHPSIVSTVRTIWWIFLLFTFLSISALWLAGMPLWHAINHAMTGLSTGGFSVTDASIATYDSASIDAALLPVMVAGSIAFPVHYLVLRGDLAAIRGDVQTRWLLVGFSALALLLSALLYVEGTYETASEALRFGAFQFVSAATCTGFQTANDLGTGWSPLAQLTVAAGMVVGGAAGSTAGGIKLIRLITLSKGTVYRIGGVFYPRNAVRHLRIDGRTLDDAAASREFEEAAIIALLWGVFLGAGTVVLLLSVRAPLENVLFEVASAQSNVGLSTGITGPAMPTVVKVAFLFNMWIGRLEIVPVLVVLRALISRRGLYA